MIKEIYTKGMRWVGIGFWGSISARVAILIIESFKNSSNLVVLLVGVLALVSILFVFLLVYGTILILQAKNRHWIWVFLLFLNVFGLIIIIWGLQDQSLILTDDSSTGQQQSTNKKNLHKLTPVFIAIVVVAIFIVKSVYWEKFLEYEKNLPVTNGSVIVSSSTLK